jgi:hypothetical protein
VNIKIIIAFQIAYIFFLVVYTLVVLMKTEEKLSWLEWYVNIYIFAMACEEIREFISSESVSLRYDTAPFLFFGTQYQYPMHILIRPSIVSAGSCRCGHGICGMFLMLLPL